VDVPRGANDFPIAWALRLSFSLPYSDSGCGGGSPLAIMKLDGSMSWPWIQEGSSMGL